MPNERTPLERFEHQERGDYRMETFDAEFCDRLYSPEGKRIMAERAKAVNSKTPLELAQHLVRHSAECICKSCEDIAEYKPVAAALIERRALVEHLALVDGGIAALEPPVVPTRAVAGAGNAAPLGPMTFVGGTCLCGQPIGGKCTCPAVPSADRLTALPSAPAPAEPTLQEESAALIRQVFDVMIDRAHVWPPDPAKPYVPGSLADEVL